MEPIEWPKGSKASCEVWSSGPQSVGGATGTGPPVRVRVRRVGGQPNPGPRRDLGARSPSLQFQGAGPGPKPACLVLSPSSGPLSRVEPPEERPQVQKHPQQGGACGAAACCEARPPALAGQGQGVGAALLRVTGRCGEAVLYVVSVSPVLGCAPWVCRAVREATCFAS